MTMIFIAGCDGFCFGNYADDDDDELDGDDQAEMMMEMVMVVKRWQK